MNFYPMLLIGSADESRFLGGGMTGTVGRPRGGDAGRLRHQRYNATDKKPRQKAKNMSAVETRKSFFIDESFFGSVQCERRCWQ